MGSQDKEVTAEGPREGLEMIWKIVPNYPDFEVSDTGLVRRTGTDTQVSLHRAGGGYLRVHLARNGGKERSRAVHNLVLEAFVGPRPAPYPGYYGAHLDGDRTNNSLANLQWATPKENVRHSLLHGTHARGERHARSKLTREQIKEIIASPESNRALSKKYGVCYSSIWQIRNGVTWRADIGALTREGKLNDLQFDTKEDIKLQCLVYVTPDIALDYAIDLALSSQRRRDAAIARRHGHEVMAQEIEKMAID